MSLLVRGLLLSMLLGLPSAVAGPVAVTVFDDAEGDVAAVSVFGAARGGIVAAAVTNHSSARLVAASATGDARSCREDDRGTCAGWIAASGTGNSRSVYAISGTGAANGTYPFSATGRCQLQYYGYNQTVRGDGWVRRDVPCWSVNPFGDANGYWLGVSGTGESRGALLSASGTGHAQSSAFCVGYDAVLMAAWACGDGGGVVLLSGTGDAHGEGGVAGVSGTGDARGAGVAASLTGDARQSDHIGYGTAVSGAGAARACRNEWYFCTAVSVFGPATGDNAVSVFGSAEGDRAVSVRDLLP